MKTTVLKSLETAALKTNVSTHTYSPLTTGETLHFSCVIKIYNRLGESPANRGATRRDETRRGRRRRRSARVERLLSLHTQHLIHGGEELNL